MGMNSVQIAYKNAYAAYKKAAEKQRKVEQEWIIRNGYTNRNGSIPSKVYLLDCNDTEWGKINESFANDKEHNRAWNAKIKAGKALRKAEDNLIAYGLSVISPKRVNELWKDTRAGESRREMVNIAFRLDNRMVQ